MALPRHSTALPRVSIAAARWRPAPPLIPHHRFSTIRMHPTRRLETPSRVSRRLLLPRAQEVVHLHAQPGAPSLSHLHAQHIVMPSFTAAYQSRCGGEGGGLRRFCAHNSHTCVVVVWPPAIVLCGLLGPRLPLQHSLPGVRTRHILRGRRIVHAELSHGHLRPRQLPINPMRTCALLG